MKKFITQLAILTATTLSTQGVLADTFKLAPDAPDSYVVVKGDTLWDISGQFLAKPWRWPEIWQLNRDSIKDPHWIYPGDIVYLDNSGDRPRLRLGKRVAALGDGQNGNSRNGAGNGSRSGASGLQGVVRVKPRIRSEPLEDSAIPTINTAAIEAFLNKPLVVDEKGLAENPRIVAAQEGRVYLGRGDIAYVRGIKDESIKEWHIYRKAQPIKDPDTRLPIAWEALYVGSARVERNGDPATIRIFNTGEEVGVGDRLMPAERARMFNVVPRAPDVEINGRIVKVSRGVSQVGKNSVVALDVGAKAGLEVGHVLKVQLHGRTIQDRQTKEHIKLPDETVGHLMVFRVFEQIAYGLVVNASQSISIGDTVVKP